MDATKGTIIAGAFVAGMAAMLLVGGAKPGNTVLEGPLAWTWTSAQAATALSGITGVLEGKAIADLTELDCGVVTLPDTTLQWRCNARYQKEVLIEDTKALIAVEAAKGRTMTIKDVEAK